MDYVEKTFMIEVAKKIKEYRANQNKKWSDFYKAYLLFKLLVLVLSMETKPEYIYKNKNIMFYS